MARVPIPPASSAHEITLPVTVNASIPSPIIVRNLHRFTIFLIINDAITSSS
jgi:hypothetical protein